MDRQQKHSHASSPRAKEFEEAHEELEKDTHPVIPFRRATDGGMNNTDWLRPLPEGTVFLCKGQWQHGQLMEFEIIQKTPCSILLEGFVPNGNAYFIWVESPVWTNHNLFHEILEGTNGDNAS